MICYHVSDEKTVQILSRHFVPSLQSAFCTSLRFVPVCSLQSAFFTDRIGIAVFVRASLKSGPKYWSSKKIWWDYLGHYDWPLCVDCMLKSSRGKAQLLSNDYSILTEDERKCAAHQYGCLWCSSAWSQRVLKGTRYGSPRCEHFGFSIHVTFLEVGKCCLRLLQTFYFFPHGFLSFIEINFDFH